MHCIDGEIQKWQMYYKHSSFCEIEVFWCGMVEAVSRAITLPAIEAFWIVQYCGEWLLVINSYYFDRQVTHLTASWLHWTATTSAYWGRSWSWVKSGRQSMRNGWRSKCSWCQGTGTRCCNPPLPFWKRSHWKCSWECWEADINVCMYS